jgi:hypothetical protein
MFFTASGRPESAALWPTPDAPQSHCAPTVKVHLARIFEKLGFENRNAASVRALEVLSRPTPRRGE